MFVYYESIMRELQTKPMYECRCDERLKTKSEKSTRLSYTGLFGELEHLQIETRLIDEKFVSVRSFIDYESTKRKLKTKYICECRCYERLQKE